MKKLLMFAALVAALASCQSNNKKTVQAEMADTTMDALPIMEVDEVFTGTIPAADGPGIDFVLTLGVTTDGIDTLYTLDMTYLSWKEPDLYFERKEERNSQGCEQQTEEGRQAYSRRWQQPHVFCDSKRYHPSDGERFHFAGNHQPKCL